MRADGASRIFKDSLAVDLQTSSADDGGWQGPLELEGDVKMEVGEGYLQCMCPNVTTCNDMVSDRLLQASLC